MNSDTKGMFAPPNITAFRQADIGNKGCLFNENNQRMTMDHQAQLVENRVKILEKEEQRMNKKIREAMRQAEKMDAIREEQNRRYEKMQEFRAHQEWETEMQRLKNQETKANSMGKTSEHQQRIFE